MNLRLRSRSRRTRAFTLIELMVVVLILAVLAALVVPRIVGSGEQAKVSAAKSDLSTISGLLDRFQLDCGRYPTTEEGLGALTSAPSGLEGKWGGGSGQPYSKKEVDLDPWSNPYVYEQSGNSNYTLMSYGSDGSEGGEGNAADIREQG